MFQDKVIWALLDDRAGNSSQTLGVAEKLKDSYVKKDIQYNPLIKLPNFIRGTSLIGVKKDFFQTDEAMPDIVISCGRRLAPVALHIKANLNNQVKLVHILDPEIQRGEFNILALPEHDRAEIADNIVLTKGAPNRISQELLNSKIRDANARFSKFEKPFLALLIGGSTKHGKFSESEALQLAKMASKKAEKLGASLLVTTSRRTSNRLQDLLKANLRVPHFFYEYDSIETNPYLEILAVADEIIVTSDSISMVSESLQTGKTTHIFELVNTHSAKHDLFLEDILKNKFATRLGSSVGKKSSAFPNAAEVIAAAVRESFLDKS